MLNILKRGKAPVMTYKCRWCETSWRASVDEEGCKVKWVAGVEIVEMPCPVCKIHICTGLNYEEGQDEEED